MGRRGHIALAVTVALLAALPGVAQAARSCAPVHASGPWGDVSVEVRVQKGRVSCREARWVAWRLFKGRGRYHDGRGFDSWWSVRRWRGDVRKGAWEMNHFGRKARIGGPYGRVGRGVDK